MRELAASPGTRLKAMVIAMKIGATARTILEKWDTDVSKDSEWEILAEELMRKTSAARGDRRSP